MLPLHRLTSETQFPHLEISTFKPILHVIWKMYIYKNSKNLQLVYNRLLSQHLTLQSIVMWHGNSVSISIDKKTQRNNSEHLFGEISVSSHEAGYDENQ